MTPVQIAVANRAFPKMGYLSIHNKDSFLWYFVYGILLQEKRA